MFKFYTIPSGDLIDNFLGSSASVKFASAFNLNDPYELKFNLNFDPRDEQHRILYFKQRPTDTEEDFLSWQKHAIKHDGYRWYAEQEIRNAIGQSITLSSFTQINTNNLMWSHYTNTHQGICIEYGPELFDHFKKLEGYIGTGNVNYSDTPPVVNGLETATALVEKIMFNKQCEWKYEKEFRIALRSSEDTDYIPIDRKYIKAVYIGSRTPSNIEKRILEVCKETDIPVYYASTMGNGYEVSFNKYKEGTGYMRSFWG